MTIETTAGRTASSRSLTRVWLPVIGPFAFLGAWFVMSSSSKVASSVVPPPHVVLAALAAQLRTGALIDHLVSSLGRSALGYAFAAGIGIPLGLLMGTIPAVRRLLNTLVELIRPVSSIAWIPLAILWFGIGLKSVVFVIFIVCIFIILLNTVGAAMEVQPDLIKAARTLGARRQMIFRKVIFPSALPGILLGLRVTLSAAWGGVIVAEMIASQKGIGYLIHHSQITFQPELVIGGMFVIGVIGYLLNRAFLIVERRLTHSHA